MLNKLRKEIDKDLKRLLGDIKSKYKLQAISPLLTGGIGDFFVGKGKRIRPLLFLISYRGYTKRKNFSYKKLLRCSLAFELLHNALLVHDDIIDSSSLRRGKPTLHKYFNKKLGVPGDDELGSQLGIAAGDIIFALAVDAFLSLDEDPERKEQALKRFTETTAFTAAGEFIDILKGIERIDRIKEKDIFLNYVLKTAKYTFECPLIAGATLAGSGKEELKKLSRIGLALGQAFQIQDDLLDMFSSSKEIGKPVLSDLNESKKTLLIWKAYKDLGKKDRSVLKHLLEKEKKTYSDLLKFRKFIKETGAHRYCFDRIDSFFREADSISSSLKMKTAFKSALKEFLYDFFSKTESLKKKLKA